MLRACVVSLALMSATMAAPASFPSPRAAPASPAVVYAKPAPPGRLVDIGGRRLHIQCKGTPEGPVVIFEGGLSQYTAYSTYGKAQDLIAPFAQVCIYDRAGLGWSDPVTGPRTRQDMVEDLHKLVLAERFGRPLVLVGHSAGGLLARFYARKYPGEVAGVVLVDATPESIVFAPGAAKARQAIIAQINGALDGAREGAPVTALPPGTPAEVQMAFTPAILRTLKQEYEAIDRVPAAMRKPGGYGTLGDTPLAIIRRGKTSLPPNAEDEQWRQAQEAMTSLSTRSFLLVAEHSGHVIPYEQPQVVAAAVQRVLTEIRDH
ncbi:alpha/beta fold hydrolase [Frateuria sp. STR12]|uniref:alpha/beta fold hydrolase n=1 Tax=Frateuria hangzhouensis TaxID=2995589 RepID=UPI002260D1A8|nr:alpha/beta hydrolase [Frateuria sp. STR12]MCX7512310.1 alpha/beta hydrolase [Frateuria sp. STR12]